MVIERGGRPILGGLEKKDPFQKSGCKYGEGCLAEEGVDCSKVGICYEIRCTMCDENNEGGPAIRPPQSTQARRVGGVRRGNRKIYIGKKRWKKWTYQKERT